MLHFLDFYDIFIEVFLFYGISLIDLSFIYKIFNNSSKSVSILHKVLVPDNREKCAVLTVDRLYNVEVRNAEQEEFL